jgi:UDP-hydrolysing UDP-N-acetyl-D-glucosamine 2-epimerase
MKIIAFSSSRADSGILQPLIQELEAHNDIQFRLLASGAHLMDKYGHTLEKETEQFVSVAVDKIQIPEFGNSLEEIGSSLGEALIAYSKYLFEAKPNLVIVLGDRMETLIFAIAASIGNIPIAHLHGGELTLGALDETHRHAISKLSSIHFTADLRSKRRLEAMGENPNTVFDFGSPRADSIRKFIPMSSSELGKKLGISLPNDFVLVTVHPALHDEPPTHDHLEALLVSLRNKKELFVLFTGTNSDPGSDQLRTLIASFVASNPDRSAFVESLGSDVYLSALSACSLAIGNSSSLILEAPILGTPRVIIGRRQLGRADLNECIGADSGAITKAIETSLSKQRHKTSHQETDTVSKRIVDTILGNSPISTKKEFHHHEK